MKRRLSRIRIAGGVVGVIVALFLFAYPTQSLLAQQRRVDQTQSQLDDLRRDTMKLNVEATRLSTPAEIERQARARFNMVRQNEKSYSVVLRAKPQDPTTTTVAP